MWNQVLERIAYVDTTYVELIDFLKERSSHILDKLEVVLTGVTDPNLEELLKKIIDSTRENEKFRVPLTSLSCEAVGSQRDNADIASLLFTIMADGIGIHDDIIDKSKVNHFRETVLGAYGLEKALLVGDLLIVKALTMFNELITENRDSTTVKRIIAEYGNLCIEMCEAEFLATSSVKNLSKSLENAETILWKAMAEIEACSRIGAMLGQGTEDEINALGQFGRCLGFIGRLLNEVQDSWNNELINLNHRIQYESVPLPILYAAQTSEERKNEINLIISNTSLNFKDCTRLLELCFESGAFGYIINLAEEKRRQGYEHLHKLTESSARNTLSLMLERVYDHLSVFCWISN
jgi:geranylgeranyl diphosphate synthase type I